jgi:hypothetical protein
MEIVIITQSWPLRMISFVLYQSPYFFALARSAPWCPYRFWNIRSSSASGPCRDLGALSWTVASPRVCCRREGQAGSREARAEVVGRALVARWLRACGEGTCFVIMMPALN